MDSSQKQRLKQLQALFEPGFRRMLVISFLLHLLLPLIYNVSFFSKEQIKPPVYRVNLVNKIVKKPQAGRPEATVPKKKKPKKKPKAKPKPIPPKPKPAAVKPKPVPVKPKPEPQPKPQPKPDPKVTPKPISAAKPKPAVSKTQEDALAKRLKAIQAKVDKQKAKQATADKFAKLKAAIARETSQIESPIIDAPPGSVTGKGNEVGNDMIEHIQAVITANWRYSQYLSANRNPEAEVKIKYSKEGTLIDYKVIKLSGVSAFDESLKRAIIKSKDLGDPLPEPVDITVIFNLKQMLDRR